ncbi:hypothetical protein [Flavobacterium sp.]|uniref:hypothetical protein n=1 Tax=Flavobacterium sp. TaxID=239 RepID=UPI002B4B2215|nr:hypothetical protein [Flavobacterium sp.]HLP64019.1 hypothetical protein [Flavobacterium sp.]
MPNRTQLNAFILIIFFQILFFDANGQSNLTTKEKITSAFENYFKMERENIHVQLDKTIFFTNESIWFKGYVYNKKLNLPFYTTTNVYLQIFDDSGKKIDSQLLYCMNGVFSGKIKLNSKYKSGYYYLQFYTNWMNNFIEDESFVQRIKIKQFNDKTIPLLESINPAKINLAFFPEGGKLISNVLNSIGVKATDINGKEIPNLTVEILDSKNQTLKSFVTNSFGMAKFVHIPDNENCKAVVNYNDSKWEYSLPNSTTNGISLEINNYTIDDKTIVKLKYNIEYEEAIRNTPLFIVIQQNEKSNIIDLKLNEKSTIKELSFSNDYLFNGVNSIRVIDANLNQIAERLIYKPVANESKSAFTISTKNNEIIDFSINSNWVDACSSISFLPISTKLSSNENILNSFIFNSYLNNKIIVKRNYFMEINRNQRFEIDLLLLNQEKNKYDWENIKQITPKETFAFDRGIQIKGTINSVKGLTNFKNHRIQLKNILSDVLSSTEVIENNEFFFENTNVTDSLHVYCDLISKVDRTKKDMIYSIVLVNKDRIFNKNYTPTPYVYPEKKDNNSLYDIEMPWFDSNTILLKEVELKKEINVLKRQNQIGNSYLRGYKIGVTISPNMGVLDFIEQNGFNVSKRVGAVSITGRTRNSLNGVPYTTPVVYIDGRQLMDFEELSGMRMEDLDEAYISSNAIVPSMNNNLGIIKLYRKATDFSSSKTVQKPKVISGGFKTITPFENAEYLSEYSTGFENFGLIYWLPWVLTDENGNVKIAITNKNHVKTKVVIDGFSNDGKLISEEKEVELK